MAGRLGNDLYYAIGAAAISAGYFGRVRRPQRSHSIQASALRKYTDAVDRGSPRLLRTSLKLGSRPYRLR